MYKVGDKIVYPMHGVGNIDGIEKKTVLGKKADYYIISIINSKMKVMIPVSNADNIGIRAIIQKKEIKKVLAVMAKDENSSVDDWKERYQNNIDKIKSGSIYEVAEVARDLFRRGSTKELSIMERKLYENAYQLVTHEIALAKDINIEDAGNIVSEALSTIPAGS
jgi:CarD family transcriptional regulator